jgi:6-phosphogluconolactonase
MLKKDYFRGALNKIHSLRGIMNTTLVDSSNNYSVTEFDSFETLARLTLPYLSKGAIALSGGSTYGRLFPLWADQSPDCSQATFFPVDERLVGFSDPLSNWGAAYRDFLSRVGRQADKAHFASSAEQYRAMLNAHFRRRMPVFDAVFLGVGDDGHTASLFPGEPYLDDVQTIVLETESPRPPVKRITLAMAPLAAAKTLIVIIAGQEKKPVCEKLFSSDPSLPITKVLSRRARSLIYIERDLIPDFAR